MAWEPGQPIDTHSTMTRRQYRELMGLPEPPEGGGVLLVFSVMCPNGTEDSARERILADIEELKSIGITGSYKRKLVRP